MPDQPPDNRLQTRLDVAAQQMAAALPLEALLAISATIAQHAAADLATRSLKVGDQAPPFTLPDARGNDCSLAALLAQGPVVISFYRGAWCPYCNLTLRAYGRALPAFRRLGASLVAISPQTPPISAAMADAQALPFAVLSDVGNRIAHQYGLRYRFSDELQQTFLSLGIDLEQFNGAGGWELPLTGTFIIDEKGSVVLAYVQENFMQRLDPSRIIAALEAVSMLSVTALSRDRAGAA